MSFYEAIFLLALNCIIVCSSLGWLLASLMGWQAMRRGEEDRALKCDWFRKVCSVWTIALVGVAIIAGLAWKFLGR